MSYIVTGGCGFIGSNFVNYLLATTDDDIFVVDSLTYAADESNITSDDKINRLGRVKLIKQDISEPGCIDHILEFNDIKAIFHFAAESHVDNSIARPQIFLRSNILGTFNLLEGVRNSKDSECRFVHISTDEVYGALPHDGPSFLESKVLEPNNVYSATKASSDLLVRSFYKTYGLDVVVTRCCNNYGPRQHTEKLLPKVISNALNSLSIPVYGKGNNIREWIYVEDHCKAIWKTFEHGKCGEIYNIGSGIEICNLDLVKNILTLLDKPFSLIKFVTDRPGHDFRYSIDSSKLATLPGEIEFTDFNTGLDETIKWYKEINKQA